MKNIFIFLTLILICQIGKSQKAFDFVDYEGYKNDTLIRFRFADGYQYASKVQMMIRQTLIEFNPKEIDNFIFMKFDKKNKKHDLNNLIQMNGGKNFDEISEFPKELIAIHTSGKNKEHLCKTILKLKK
jgi:hypothetical protein